ncbi:MAG: ABC transporter ATP-binding protein [Clostridia bacterium]|nr:ABC transporter ATP-binding protein [Clostridia bacterium]
MDAILSIRNLDKSFGRRKVIDNISFDVLPGEVFGFLGPNGAGKTTTIKMVMGFLTPDAGTIRINGFDLRRDYEKAMAMLGGIVENPEMYKDLSGQVNLEMYARLHGNVPPERIREAVAMVGMENRIREKVKKYSLGMKQRVGLAQAVLHRPRLLILDEPTNGLDPAGIRELRDILKRLAHEEGVAVFVSSHQLAEMQLMCDRVGIIHRGALMGVKPIGELMAEAAGRSAFRITTGEDAAVRAAAVLAAAGVGTVRKALGREMEVEMDEAQVPDAVRALVREDLPIYGVRRLESSLEEAFIQVTGGGVPIA